MSYHHQNDNMKKANNLIKQLILFFIGMSIIQFGVALFLKTNIGSDPFTVFIQGLAFMLNKTGLKDSSLFNIVSGNTQITPGFASIIILIVLFVIILIAEKKRIKIGTDTILPSLWRKVCEFYN